MGIRGELYTTQINFDNRSYFFNVKENRNHDVFLQIVESKVKDGQDDRRAIVVFADDMQEFLSGMDDALTFIEKDRKEKAKARAEKKAAKEAKFGQGDSDSDTAKKKVYRRKGESRLVAERKAEKKESSVKKTGRVIVTSKRNSPKEDNEY
ncbi:MAG: DUF3276 family protein [Treponema sp.]|nr:DUF3276 family protein [Treponema sp.]